MGRCFIQIVMGPAGSGKSTYCQAMQHHAEALSTTNSLLRRTIHVANLDPAAEQFGYQVAFDVRDLISVEEVMDELGLGPNGGLIYCMEYLVQNLDWLENELDSFGDEDYLILDCPGQLELYTHVPLMKTILDRMKQWGYESSMVGVFLLDTTFVCDISKFISGSLLSLSAMIALELPHVNVLTKCDLMRDEEIDEILNITSASYLWDLEQDRTSLLPPTTSDLRYTTIVTSPNNDDDYDNGVVDNNNNHRDKQLERRRRNRQRLTDSICQLLDDYTMVSFCPLNIQDEDSIDTLLATIDSTIQYGEDLEVRGATQDNDIHNDDDDNDGDNDD